MAAQVWTSALEHLRDAHVAYPALAEFCAFPTDIQPQDVSPYDIAPRTLFEAETNWNSRAVGGLCDAFLAASPHAHWRETYKDTDIGQDFMDRFGCYCLIGKGGAFTSNQMLAFLVYMPAGLHYPWHEHPAEELYFVLAGQAEFHRHGEPSKVLGAGEASFHASNQPHAMTTHDAPVAALVLWRNEFDVAPKLSA